MTVRVLGALSASVFLSLTLLPGSLSHCLAADAADCACCAQTTVPEQGCCGQDAAAPPVAAQGGETSCCIDLEIHGILWMASGPSVSLPLGSGPVTLSGVDGSPVDVATPATAIRRPPAPVPLHIRLCCPRA